MYRSGYMTLTSLSRLLVVLAIVSPGVVSACSSATDEAPHLQLGWYSLRRVNGAPLPGSVQISATCTVAVASGYLRLTDTSSFDLDYSGSVACPGDPLDGQAWSAFYTGLIVLGPDTVVFRIPDLSHLGLDSLVFLGTRVKRQLLEATVPQLPTASGPPVTLRFAPVASDPRSAP